MSENVTLENLSSGAVLERFEQELDKVLVNILDPNTKATAVRSVTLTIKIKPSDNRDVGSTEIVTTSKLAPAKPVTTILFIGRENGKPVAAERNANVNQTEIFEPTKSETTNAKVTKLNGH